MLKLSSDQVIMHAAVRDAVTGEVALRVKTDGASWKSFTLTYLDFAAAATTNTIDLFQLPAGADIRKVRIVPTESFAGGSISAYTVEVGILSDPNKYGVAFDVFQAPGGTVFGENYINGMESVGADTMIKATATSTGDNLDQASAGSVTIFVETSQLPI